MKEDDLVITIAEVKPVSKPLKPGYIEVLPNRYVVGSSSRLCGGSRMSKETFEEFLTRLHCSQVPFEDVAKDLFEEKKENNRLKAAIRKAIESEDSAWADDHLLEALEATE